MQLHMSRVHHAFSMRLQNIRREQSLVRGQPGPEWSLLSDRYADADVKHWNTKRQKPRVRSIRAKFYGT